MQVEQLLDSYISMGSKIDSVWSMYIVVHLGIFWFFFLLHRPLLFVERLIAFGAYTFFSYVNANSLIDGYTMLKAMRSDIVNSLKSSFNEMPSTYQAIVQVDYANLPQLIMFTHGGAWALVALVLIFRNRMIEYYRKNYPDHWAASRHA